MKLKHLTSLAALGAVTTGIALGTTPASAAPEPAGTEYAYYAPTPEVPQAGSPAGLRRYLSNVQSQFDLQSFPMYGSLITSDGKAIAFSAMNQQTNHITDLLPSLSYALEGVMWNAGRGIQAGGVLGVPEYTLPLTVTQRPWSIRSQAMSLGTAPQFVDMRVVSGEIGLKGAVYEVTASVGAATLPDGAAAPATVYVRATDTMGMAQWGYGPSGLMPQWIYPYQRNQIVTKFAGSIESYLAATKDKMRGQGGYYYTTPMLKVDSFTITQAGRRPLTGTGGWLLMDNVNQSFGPHAEDVIKNDVTWLEFSTQLPGTGQALKIGRVAQPNVGVLPYASLAEPSNGKNPNGSLTTLKWPITGISIKAVAGHKWTSPVSGLTYDLKYQVKLHGSPATGTPDGVLTYEALRHDQEVSFKGSRSVYEGLFTVTGILDGHHVSGQAWAEIQPAGSLS